MLEILRIIEKDGLASPEKIAEIALDALESKHPKYVYKINRNPLLLMLNMLKEI